MVRSLARLYEVALRVVRKGVIDACMVHRVTPLIRILS